MKLECKEIKKGNSILKPREEGIGKNKVKRKRPSKSKEWGE